MNALRDAGLITLSLVAEEEGQVIGCAVFSRMTFAGDDPGMKAVALGPIAVRQQYRRRGVGAALVREGIERSREAGFEVMALYGSVSYYRRFGFEIGERLNLPSGDEGIRPGNFQALMLKGEAPAQPLKLRFAPQFFMT